jgi:Ca2+-binding RTX toxin-like protein
MTYVSISGGGNASVHIYGSGSVVAGNGNDTITIDGHGSITVGAGNDSINLGRGNDTISEAGRASVHGAFGSATIVGGNFDFLKVQVGSDSGQHVNTYGDDGGRHDGGFVYQDIALSGKATLVGGDHCTQFIGGAGSVVMQGGTGGNDTFVGGSGQATMTGGTGHNLFIGGSGQAIMTGGTGGQNLFEFGCGTKGTDVITNFVSGHDQLYLEGQSLSYLQSKGDVSVSHGNTYISLDGGQTTVELKGFTSLTSTDVTTHKG